MSLRQPSDIARDTRGLDFQVYCLFLLSIGVLPLCPLSTCCVHAGLGHETGYGPGMGCSGLAGVPGRHGVQRLLKSGSDMGAASCPGVEGGLERDGPSFASPVALPAPPPMGPYMTTNPPPPPRPWGWLVRGGTWWRGWRCWRGGGKGLQIPEGWGERPWDKAGVGGEA